MPVPRAGLSQELCKAYVRTYVRTYVRIPKTGLSNVFLKGRAPRSGLSQRLLEGMSQERACTKQVARHVPSKVMARTSAHETAHGYRCMRFSFPCPMPSADAFYRMNVQSLHVGRPQSNDQTRTQKKKLRQNLHCFLKCGIGQRKGACVNTRY